LRLSPSAAKIYRRTPVDESINDGDATLSQPHLNARKGQLAEYGAISDLVQRKCQAVASPGSGAARITQVAGNTLKLRVEVANMTGIIFAHLHNACSSANGAVVVTLIPTQSPFWS